MDSNNKVMKLNLSTPKNLMDRLLSLLSFFTGVGGVIYQMTPFFPFFPYFPGVI